MPGAMKGLIGRFGTVKYRRKEVNLLGDLIKTHFLVCRSHLTYSLMAADEFVEERVVLKGVWCCFLILVEQG